MQVWIFPADLVYGLVVFATWTGAYEVISRLECLLAVGKMQVVVLEKGSGWIRQWLGRGVIYLQSPYLPIYEISISSSF